VRNPSALRLSAGTIMGSASLPENITAAIGGLLH
jgi:hypothetical protein